MRQFIRGNKIVSGDFRTTSHPDQSLCSPASFSTFGRRKCSLVIDLASKSRPNRDRPVEYVKVCSLYGVGYYHIPGTDTCIKIGGYVRYEAYHNDVSGHYADRNPSANFTRNSQTFGQQARFRLTTDVRTQTEYGTLRSYFSFGFNFLNGTADADNGGIQNAIALERAFIQFAGFTFGRADTFFGFYNGAAYGLVPLGLDGSSGPVRPQRRRLYPAVRQRPVGDHRHRRLQCTQQGRYRSERSAGDCHRLGLLNTSI